jgi:methylenetetrahydrofolate--tRNA-(uracil-5-)-methyltransferase
VPAGSALAVDRELFSQAVHDRITRHPNISVVRDEVTELPVAGVVATGPLTSERLTRAMVDRLGASALSFYDAIAPVVSADSLDLNRLYPLSRYGKGDGDDYLNAPMDAATYEAFIDALVAGDQHQGHAFDEVP